MNDLVQQEILQVLPEVIAYLRKKNYSQIGQLSNALVHNLSIYQDEDSLTFAVLLYTLSKIGQRNDSLIPDTLFDQLKSCKEFLRRGKIKAYRQTLKTLYKKIRSLDKKVKTYINDVFYQAGINKAEQLYKHGISLAQTAKVMGINQWDLQNYIGNTRIVDHERRKVTITERLTFARKIFAQ